MPSEVLLLSRASCFLTGGYAVVAKMDLPYTLNHERISSEKNQHKGQDIHVLAAKMSFLFI
jgi:hypothetical protein